MSACSAAHAHHGVQCDGVLEYVRACVDPAAVARAARAYSPVHALSALDIRHKSYMQETLERASIFVIRARARACVPAAAARAAGTRAPPGPLDYTAYILYSIASAPRGRGGRRVARVLVPLGGVAGSLIAGLACARATIRDRSRSQLPDIEFSTRVVSVTQG